MVDHTIREHILSNGQERQFRSEFTKSDWARTTRLRDVLEVPEQTFRALTIQRGMGTVSVARIRQLLARTFSETYPDHWEEAKNAVEADTPAIGLRARKLAEFITAWGCKFDSIAVTGRFVPSNGISLRKMYQELTDGAEFVYASETIPIVIKTEATVQAESGLDRSMNRMNRRLRTAVQDGYRDVQVSGLVLIDTFMMDDLLHGWRYYRDMTEGDRIKQLRIMYDFYRTHTGQKVYVTDFHATGLSPAIVWGDRPLMRHSFGGFLELTAPDLVELFRDRAEQARDMGVPLKVWFAMHVDHPVIAAAIRPEPVA